MPADRSQGTTVTAVPQCALCAALPGQVRAARLASNTTSASGRRARLGLRRPVLTAVDHRNPELLGYHMAKR
jgi:hypothetical protein